MEYRFREQFDHFARATKPKPAPKPKATERNWVGVTGSKPNFLQGMPFSCSLYRPRYMKQASK